VPEIRRFRDREMDEGREGGKYPRRIVSPARHCVRTRAFYNYFAHVLFKSRNVKHRTQLKQKRRPEGRRFLI
ncbi:MAG: hypothetical protein ACXWIP_22695, partial [Burkholderiales bacterium]